MNKLVIIVSSLIVCAGLVFTGLSNRYYIDTSTKLKVDRLTGKTYKITEEVQPTVITEKTVDNLNEMLGMKPSPTYVNSSTPNLGNSDQIKNLELLKNTSGIYSKFKKYYNDVLIEYEKDPLFCESSSMKMVFLDFYSKFEKYSYMLDPKHIVDALEQSNIKTPEKFIDKIIESLS